MKLRYPCGHCMACRLNIQRDKKIRLVHETQYHDKSVFITLTYSDDNLPVGATLVREDPQLFMKRLRKCISPDKIKAFGCGEYGDTTHRPHYHVIVYGLDMLDKRVFTNAKYVPSKQSWYVDCKPWQLGHVTVAPVNEARCAYVAKYCVKKYTGEKAPEVYAGRLPEFCWTSHGIGLEWAKDHSQRLKMDDCVTVRGKKIPIPRYYVDKIFDAREKFLRSLKRDKEIEKSIVRIGKERASAGMSVRRSIQYDIDANNARVQRMSQMIQNKKGKNNV